MDLYQLAEIEPFYRKVIKILEEGLHQKPIKEEIQKLIIEQANYGSISMLQARQWVNELDRAVNILTSENAKCNNSDYACFWIKFYGLITEIKDKYSLVLEAVEKKGITIVDESNEYFPFLELAKGIRNIISNFTDFELEFIEYTRHNHAHPFQDSYEPKLKKTKNNDYKIKDQRNGKNIYELKKSFETYIKQHGGNEYLIAKLFASKIKKDVIVINNIVERYFIVTPFDYIRRA